MNMARSLAHYSIQQFADHGQLGPANAFVKVIPPKYGGQPAFVKWMAFYSPAADIILGKYAAAIGFLVLLLAPTLVFVVALEIYGRPDYGELLCGYLGVLLAGSVYLASGILASTLTSSQVVAYLMTVFFWIIVLLATKGVLQTDLLPVAWQGRVDDLVIAADPELRLRDFAIGLFDSGNFVYFGSLTIVLLIASARSLEMRRWS